MAKTKAIEQDGEVIEALPNTKTISCSIGKWSRNNGFVIG